MTNFSGTHQFKFHEKLLGFFNCFMHRDRHGKGNRYSAATFCWKCNKICIINSLKCRAC